MSEQGAVTKAVQSNAFFKSSGLKRERNKKFSVTLATVCVRHARTDDFLKQNHSFGKDKDDMLQKNILLESYSKVHWLKFVAHLEQLVLFYFSNWNTVKREKYLLRCLSKLNPHPIYVFECFKSNQQHILDIQKLYQTKLH